MLCIGRVSWFLAVLLASSCGLVLDAEPPQDDGGADSAMRDASSGDAPEMDTTPVLDAMPRDVPRPRDVSVDVSADASFGCAPPAVDSTVVAHYTFDSDSGSTIVDETGLHDGTTENGVSHVEGRCGQALFFPDATPLISHAHIRDHEAFDIMEGSLELYVRLAVIGSFGIVSRDAQGVDEPGHFGIFTSNEGHVIVRLQDISVSRGGLGDNAVWLCSNRPLVVGEWEHVGVSWGGDQDVQLWLGGELATFDGTTAISWESGGMTRPVPCGSTVSQHGIDGNSLSWILGANSNLRSAALPDRIRLPFLNGAIDELRILRVRQDYTRL